MNRTIRGSLCRRLLAVSASVAGTASLLSAAPAVQSETANWWPMKVGNSWTLDTVAGANKMSQVVTVTSAKKSGSATLATLDYRANGTSINQEVYRITSAAVERVSGGPRGTLKMIPPIAIIRAPMKPGQTWTWSGVILAGRERGGGQKVKATAKLSVSGSENVTTPAGTFKAIKVHSAIVVDANGVKMEMPNDYWFAAGVGMVRQTATMNNAVIEGTLTKYTVN